MAELIPIVEQTGSVSWQSTVTLPGNVGAVSFQVLGGTFDDGSTEKDITPTADSDYDVSLKAVVDIGDAETKPVLLYYTNGDKWFIVHSASRIFVRAQKKELDYRLIVRGMDALPLNATVNPTFGGLVLGGGVRVPTAQAMQQADVARFRDLETSFFDPDLPVSVVYDRAGQVLYYLGTTDQVSKTKILGTLRNVDLAGYKVTYANGTRTTTIFRVSGHVEQFDETLNPIGNSIDLGYELNRVVCRRAGVGAFTVDSYVAFDKRGRAHYLDAAFKETKVLSDKFYVNGSDSYDVLSTLDGKLVGSTITTPPADVFWYQFVPSSLLAYGHDGTNIYEYNIRDDKMFAGPRALVQNDMVVYNSTASWTETGGKLVAGMDTNGTDALFSFSDNEVPVAKRGGWPYIELLTPPYGASDTYDRLFFYAARPTTNLKHLAIRNYKATWPDLSDTELGPTVHFEMTVEAEDPDLTLPITAPEGMTVTAEVNGKPVTEVRDGDYVSFTLSHSFATGTSFPLSIGRSVYQFETKADSIPDQFEWKNILGAENDTWQRTEDVPITGINVPTEIEVLIDGKAQDNRVKILIDGVETQAPATINNGQKLGFEILHKDNTTRVSVQVGSELSVFGVYTLTEQLINVGRHFAYMPVGKEVHSDEFENTNSVPITLTIDSTDAIFAQGGQRVVLDPGQKTHIIFIPRDGRHSTISFSSEQHQYEWYVWSDFEWLGDQPETKRAERYVMADTGELLFGDIPQNFWTYIKVPAGVLVDIDGVRVELPLDVRGVYKEQDTILGPFECAETIIKMYGYPSHEQPHTLMLGDAPLSWLYDLTEDPTYEAHGTHAATFGPVFAYDQAFAHAADTIEAKTYTEAGTHVVIVADNGHQVLGYPPEWFTFEAQQVPTVTDTAMPDLVVGQSIQSDSFRMADLIAASDIKFDRFDLFTPETGSTLVSDFIDERKFIGTNKLATVDSFALFEMLIGNAVTSDSFTAEFVTETAIKSDTFANNFVARLLDAPQYFDLFRARTRSQVQARSDQIRPRHRAAGSQAKADQVTVKAVKSKQRHLVETVRPKHQSVSDVYAADLIASRHRSAFKAYHQQTAPASFVQNAVRYQVEWARPLWRPNVVSYKSKAMAPRYVDPIYHPIVLFLPEIPFVRHHISPVVWKHEHLEAMQVLPVAAYELNPSEPSFAYTALAVRAEELPGSHLSVRPLDKADMATAVKVDDSPVIAVATSQSRTIARTVIRADVHTVRKAENNVYGIELPVIDTWLAPPNHGDIKEPLKEGYFATELDALRNATDVWGFDPSMVYGIQQPNGYWTWAQVTVCDESCGSMSCSARGYLSGG